MNPLISIDWIAEIIGEDGRLAAKGYRAFAEENETLKHLANLQADTRDAGAPVLHVRLGFDRTYTDQPKASPLFGVAAKAGILAEGTESTEIVDEVAPIAGDIVMTKKRMSAFYGTNLELTLRCLGATRITIAGVATDLAVQSAARDAHDRDFQVVVAASACAAATSSDHEQALETMAKFATILD